MMVLSIVVLLALLGVVFYHRVNLTLSSLILVAYTAAMGAIGLWSFWLLLPLAIVLLPLTLSSVPRDIGAGEGVRGRAIRQTGAERKNYPKRQAFFAVC